jgi:hypothetical protein
MRRRAEPDPHTAINVLAQGYAGLDGYLNLFASAPRCYDVIDSFPTDDPSAEIHLFVRDLGDDHNLYFGVATRNRRLVGARGGKEDCLLLPFLFADLDIRDPKRHQGDKRYPATRHDALALVERLPLPPTVIVSTGGGIHVYWKLDPALTIGEAEPILARLKLTLFRLAAEHGVEIDNVFEVARMMRLPGSVNNKAAPVPVGGPLRRLAAYLYRQGLGGRARCVAGATIPDQPSPPPGVRIPSAPAGQIVKLAGERRLQRHPHRPRGPHRRRLAGPLQSQHGARPLRPA